MTLLEELPRLPSGHHGEGCHLPGVGVPFSWLWPHAWGPVWRQQLSILDFSDWRPS